MQRIERYGVIALVFLLVTILAVAVWGQRKNQSLLSFLKRDKPAEIALVDPAAPVTTAPYSGLGLSDPVHVVNPAAPQPAPGTVASDPTLTLAPPAGPGFDAVTFAPTPTPGGSGFVGGSALPGALPQTPGAAGNAAVIESTVQPAAAGVGARSYKVKSGDTLGSIAQRELGSTKRWKEIEALNGVKPERLQVGMLLKLPAGAASAGPDVLVRNDAPRSTPRSVPPTSGKSYNVRPGDSLSKIAASQLGDANRYGEILAMNPGVDPAKLSIGQTIRLPADAKPASSASKSKPRPSSSAPEVARADTTPKKARVQ